ncbi:CAZyme family GH71 [Penicillium roqueforti]|nr:CAZyme family GH71 [Penicillium roqueforti]KAI3188421.1 CAZyme family GH71 [Penicillium roqueforti]
MRLSSLLAVALLGHCQVQAAAVFAHFMLMNAENYTVTDWQTDIQAALDAHINAFALNMAVDSRVAEILPTAFQAAHDKHFSLFFSFDYAGNGPWKAGDVAALLEQYTASTAYYLYKGQYIVSTFEGPAHAEDWIDLKQQYNVFFVPDWSSIGAKPASQLGGSVADALFSWAAVSPWFFTNLPGYDKNWLWRGDDLCKSHYIGPLYDYAMEAFTIGKAPSNFAKDMPHDGTGATPIDGLEDYGLCNFACSHGYCPEGAYIEAGSKSSGEVYVPLGIWDNTDPEVQCTSTGTKTTILNVPSLVTDKVPFWPVVIGADTSPTGFYSLQSFMPESSELVLSGDEAPFSLVPSGSATPAPVFPGAPYTVTYQPQAMKSISLSVNIPSVTWSSASPTESCTSGCGTDSCKLFGGCDSTDPIDDCGLYGCGGGCSIQSCDQSCGVACSTDQHHLDSDSTGSSGGGGGGGSDSGSSSSGGSADGQQANLPMDYDGPDGLANGEWNPTPILVEDAAAVTSGMSAIMAQGTPCFESALSLLTASQTVPADLYSTVHASATSLKQSMSTQISDLKDKINAADPENFQAVTSWFTTWQDDFNVRVDSMIQGIEEPYAEIELQVSLGRAQDDVDIFSEAASIEANEDICEINPNMGSSTHPITRKRAIPPSCAPDFQGDPGEPSNAAKIPEWIGCDTRLGFEYASSADILGAMKQGIKYFLSNARGVPRSGQPDWQTAAKAAYPHIYSNSDNIDFSDECMNAGGDYTGFIEFPIMPDGSILEAGRNSRIDVGVQRVVFKAKASRDRAATDWSYLYCGVMSHFTNLLETHIIDGEPKRVLPFKLCEATCASDVVGQCSWMWA